MRHKVKGKKLNRTSAHKKAMMKNMAKSLIEHEQLHTTLSKAKVLRPYVEKLVTRSMNPTNLNKNYALSILQSRELTHKLISELSVQYKARPGGYLRIVRGGFRYGDNAPMAYIEFVDRGIATKQ